MFFAIGPGAIPWIITSELFGSEARGKAVSIATLVNWLSNFVVTVSFPFIQVRRLEYLTKNLLSRKITRSIFLFLTGGIGKLQLYFIWYSFNFLRVFYDVLCSRDKG